MISLVGYTGFVGSNIYEKGRANIDKVYNSSNISEAFGTHGSAYLFRTACRKVSCKQCSGKGYGTHYTGRKKHS